MINNIPNFTIKPIDFTSRYEPSSPKARVCATCFYLKKDPNFKKDTCLITKDKTILNGSCDNWKRLPK